MLTIPVTPEIEARLQSEARKRGLSVEEFALQKLLADLPTDEAPLSDEEFDAALDELQNSFATRPFDAAATRAHKGGEMAHEEAKHARLFGASDEAEAARLAAIDRFIGMSAELAPLRLSERVRRDRDADKARDERDFQQHSEQSQ